MVKAKGDTHMWHWGQNQVLWGKINSTTHNDPINPYIWDYSLNLVKKPPEF